MLQPSTTLLVTVIAAVGAAGITTLLGWSGQHIVVLPVVPQAGSSIPGIPDGVLRGRVVDASGHPIAGVLLIVRGAGMSNSQGRFVVPV